MAIRFLRRLLTRRGLVLGLFAILVLALAAPHAWAWYHLRAARAELAKYHPEQALESLKACERVWGNRGSIHLLASRAARQNGEFETAARELRECQKLSGGATEETAFEWALLRASAGSVLEVEDYLQKQIRQSPESAPLIWEALAEGYLRIYRADTAMACLTLWLDRDKDNVRALELRGMTFVTGKGVVNGAKDYRAVLSIDPSRRKTRSRLVACLLDLGGYEEAAEHLELLSRESPDDAEVAARLARCYFMLRRSNEGRKLLEGALQKNPENGLCLRTLGQFELTEGRRPEAEQILRRAVAAMPEDYQTNWLLFQALQQQGKLEDAKAQLKRAEVVKEQNERFGELASRKLAENPLDPSLHCEIGLLLIRTGREEVGLQWLKSALELDPGHVAAHTALAEYYERTGDKAKAAEHRQKAGGAPSK